MANINPNLSNIRTLEDVVNMLSILFFNLNNENSIYYTMFLDPVPQDVILRRYDEAGNLEEITIPNRAKDRILTYSGTGNPTGVQVANIGALYVDTASSDLYYKSKGSNDAYGWILLWSSENLQEGVANGYLSPTGDGSQLQFLNANSITSGTLAVARGGTGSNNFGTGLVKADGTNPFTIAYDGNDYLGPNSACGMICFYPAYGSDENPLPYGWLPCNGSAVSRTTYANLFSRIQTAYGAGDGSTTFNLPNLTDYFIRCWNFQRETTPLGANARANSKVQTHIHNINTSTGIAGVHSHTRGSMNITGWASLVCNMPYGDYANGAFYFAGGHNTCFAGGIGGSARGLYLNAANSWVGNTSVDTGHAHAINGATDASNGDTTVFGTETHPKFHYLVPMIKW